MKECFIGKATILDIKKIGEITHLLRQFRLDMYAEKVQMSNVS